MLSKMRQRVQIAIVALVASFFTMAQASEITGLDGSVTALAFSPDGKTLAAADGGFDLSLWDASSGSRKTKFTGLASGTSRVAWSPDGKTVYGTTGNDWIAWDVASGKEKMKVKGEMTRTAPSIITLSADGKTIAAVGRGMLKLWNAGTGAALGEYEAHPNYGIKSVAFSRDGRFVVTTSDDRNAQLTETAGGSAGTAFKCSSRPNAAEFSPDGKTVFVADQVPSLHQFDVATGEDKPAAPMSRAAKQIAVSSDGMWVACAASSLELWSRAESRWVVKPVEGSSGATAVAISPDGKFIALGDMEGRIHVWAVKDLLAKN